MKKGIKVFVNLALLFALCIPAFSQPSSKSQETFEIDSFDSDQEWSWTVNASRFVAEGYPKIGYFSGMPNSLKALKKDVEDPKVLGVKVAYNRKGDNWMEIYPVKDGTNYEIPLVGNVQQFDFWVWGANYLYYLELMIRDSEGRVHVLPCGNMRFHGWKNLCVSIPGWISQHSRLRSGPENLTFIGFRVRSDAAEYVDDFTIYFDSLKFMTNSLSFIYDGYELRDSDFDDAEQGSVAGNRATNTKSSNSTAGAK